MAATALFEPKTTSFGQLVLHARTAARPDWARWSVTAEDEDTRVSRNNLFITIGFVAAFVTFLSGLYVADNAMFARAGAHAPAPVSSSVDYE